MKLSTKMRAFLIILLEEHILYTNKKEGTFCYLFSLDMMLIVENITPVSSCFYTLVYF